jgi:hypothetical protein
MSEIYNNPHAEKKRLIQEIECNYFTPENIKIISNDGGGGYHLAIEIPDKEICYQSYFSSSFEGVLLALGKVIYEDKDGLRIDGMWVFEIFKSLSDLKESLVRKVQTPQSV